MRDYNVTTKDSRVIITKMCKISNTEYKVEVSTTQFNEWKSGSLIQNVMPELSMQQREFLISGYTPAEWEDMFGIIEEDE